MSQRLVPGRREQRRQTQPMGRREHRHAAAHPARVRAVAAGPALQSGHDSGYQTHCQAADEALKTMWALR
jgi:hypothetical protein